MRHIFLGLATVVGATLWPAFASAENNKEFSQSVAATLRDSGRLADYSIGVTTENGVVTLNGRVANREQMQDTVQMTSSMPGVAKVVNHLEIKPSKGGSSRRAEQANDVAEEASPNAQATSFPDLTLPAQNAAPHKDLVSKLRASRSTPATKKPTAKTAKAYAVQQASQTVPRTFTPNGNAGAMGGQQPSIPKMAMAAPFAAAGMAAGAAMGQCPPGAMGGDGPGMYGPGGGGGAGPMPMAVPSVNGGVAPARYDQPYMPNYAWPSYAAYPNYAAVAYPRQYSPTAWPYIGPFYPYPQVPLGWRKVMLEWDDGWWMLNFKQ